MSQEQQGTIDDVLGSGIVAQGMIQIADDRRIIPNGPMAVKDRARAFMLIKDVAENAKSSSVQHMVAAELAKLAVNIAHGADLKLALGRVISTVSELGPLVDEVDGEIVKRKLERSSQTSDSRAPSGYDSGDSEKYESSDPVS